MDFFRTQNLAIRIGSKFICSHLNLQITASEIWGILGPNGAGKTTLLQVLAGLQKAESGKIFFQDKKLSAWSAKEIARELGILLQDSSMGFSQTVYEFCLTGRYPHLSYFGRERAEDFAIVEAALQLMELDTISQQKVETLSGGERRRLSIATLLVQTPKIYLLDEPTNHLDIRHQLRVLNHFKKIAQEKSATVVMTLHDFNLAKHYCDKVLLMFPDGKILHGNAKDLLTWENLEMLYQCSLKELS